MIRISHNAVMHVEDEAYGENEVVEELQKGYMYRDTVVRHSMVKWPTDRKQLEFRIKKKRFQEEKHHGKDYWN